MIAIAEQQIDGIRIRLVRRMTEPRYVIISDDGRDASFYSRIGDEDSGRHVFDATVLLAAQECL